MLVQAREHERRLVPAEGVDVGAANVSTWGVQSLAECEPSGAVDYERGETGGKSDGVEGVERRGEGEE